MSNLLHWLKYCYQVTSLVDDSEKSDSAESIADLLSEMSGEGISGSGSGFGSGSGSGLGGSGIEIGSGGEADSSEEEEDPPEFVEVSEDFYYMAHVMRLMAALHSLVSLAMLVAYYHLKVKRFFIISFYCSIKKKLTRILFKVPLAIFKREKEIARRVEFDGLYISETPEEDDIKAHWDKMVISAKTFPVNYWDKFVKKKVRQKYSEAYDFDYISNLLGMEKTSFSQQEDEGSGLLHLCVTFV